jgi:FkbM family methyltransferase
MGNMTAALRVDGIDLDIVVDAELVYKLASVKWFRDKGDARLTTVQPLIDSDIVVDVGGNVGVWAGVIHEKYAPRMYVLEPIDAYCDGLRAKFAGQDRVTILNHGLGEPGVHAFALAQSSTSQFDTPGATGTVQATLKSFDQFMADENLHRIDLLQINIEGGEYTVLEQILASPHLRRIKKMQIQYHLNVPDAVEKRQSLRTRLAQTHRELYCYPFVWEAWELLPY